MPSRPVAALLARSRPANRDELNTVPWLATLPADEARQVGETVRVVEVEAGELICRHGRPVTYWFGVVDGLLKMNNDAVDGPPMTFAGLPPGAWFGEGTVLKGESYRYNVQALRRSTVAGITAEVFHALLDRSIAFNRFVMQQLNERLGQFIAAREFDRLTRVEERVARNLAALFHPVLYPGVGQVLRITQQELAYLVGISRQSVNEALHALQEAGALRIEYGGLRVLDLEQLRRFHARPRERDV